MKGLKAILVAMTGLSAWVSAAPISLNPVNPHYFQFNGEPTILITSTEHYGAVLNLDFDYIPYLNELQARGFNLTRTSMGTTCEYVGWFITPNPWAPAPGRFSSPWARSSVPGYANGGNKFDLTKWDEAYFARLKDFVAQAGARGIVVEISLFSPMFDASIWALNPMNINNNINGFQYISPDDNDKLFRRYLYTLSNPDLLAVQEAVVRKTIQELQPYDNVYYEIFNEPYYGADLDWQQYMIDVIVDEENAFPHKHMIAQNVFNETGTITDPNPAVSVFNFHYALQSAVDLNYGRNKVIANDETGFHGNADYTYRREGWEFIMAGGGVYDHLDATFTSETPDGSGVNNNNCGGGASIRSQIAVMKSFIEGFDFIHMVPRTDVVEGGRHALVDEGKAYAIYVESNGVSSLGVTLPAGEYLAEWVDTLTGAVAKSETFVHGGGLRNLAAPSYAEDIALRIRMVDADMDGMADAWEIQYFGGTNIAGGGPDEDWDKDGRINLEEFQAGTDPTDPNSLLKVISFAPSGTSWVIKWTSVANRHYSVDWSHSIGDPWELVASNIPATPPVNTYTNFLPNPSKSFYRILLN
ncbi:MAG: DUF6298 domain-containing protein [Kiritimatiellales bacterium]|nr:DUF6298 domain-containing protein [Kiritimatiellales bacterium]MCF7863716.1 DUF6298 domain-containing protein [Kiritimatiellales bacterium]